jgi:hypothetical protein
MMTISLSHRPIRYTRMILVAMALLSKKEMGHAPESHETWIARSALATFTSVKVFETLLHNWLGEKALHSLKIVPASAQNPPRYTNTSSYRTMHPSRSSPQRPRSTTSAPMRPACHCNTALPSSRPRLFRTERMVEAIFSRMQAVKRGDGWRSYDQAVIAMAIYHILA